jgi:hypothetical protein
MEHGPPRPELWDEHVVLLAASHLRDPERVLPLVSNCTSDLYRALALGMLTGTAPELPDAHVLGPVLTGKRDLVFWREACTTATELGLYGQVDELDVLVDCLDEDDSKLRFRPGKPELALSEVYRVLTATHIVFGATHYGSREAEMCVVRTRLTRLFHAWLQTLGSPARKKANLAVGLEIHLACLLLGSDCGELWDAGLYLRARARGSREWRWHTDLLLQWLESLKVPCSST